MYCASYITQVYSKVDHDSMPVKIIAFMKIAVIMKGTNRYSEWEQGKVAFIHLKNPELIFLERRRSIGNLN
jgi:hypothetical protein